MTGIQTQHLFSTVVQWLTCLTKRRSTILMYKQRLHSLTIYYPGPAETIKGFGRWTHKVFLFSICSNHSPKKGKSLSFSFCPKGFIRFLCECILNLFKMNLWSIKKKHVTKIQNIVRLFFLKRITWKGRRDLASKKELQLIIFVTRSVINQLHPVCSHFWFCTQWEFEYPVSYKAGISKVSSFTESHVPNSFA